MWSQWVTSTPHGGPVLRHPSRLIGAAEYKALSFSRLFWRFCPASPPLERNGRAILPVRLFIVVAKQLCSVRRKTHSPYFHALELTKWLWLDGSVGAFSGADGYNSLYRWRQRTIQELWWPLRRPQPQTTASERNRIRNTKNSNVSTCICLYENRKRQEKRNCTRWLDAFVVGCDEK